MKKTLLLSLTLSLLIVGGCAQNTYKEIIKENPTTQIQTEKESNEMEVIDRYESINETIPFETVEQKDSSLEKGITKISQEGIEGIETTTFKITYTKEGEVSKEIVSEKVTREPVNKVVLLGTKEIPPVTEKPVATTPKPTEPKVEKPETIPSPPIVKPVKQKPVEQKPVEQKPVEQKPVEQKPVETVLEPKPIPTPEPVPAPEPKPTPEPVPEPTPVVKSFEYWAQVEQEIIVLTNQHRVNNGLRELTQDKSLNSSARAHSKFMFENNVFEHTKVYKVGENIHRIATANPAKRTAEYIVNAWKNSPGHNANMLDPRYTKMGAGVTFGEQYFKEKDVYLPTVNSTQHFSF